jgi:hypothetical protein
MNIDPFIQVEGHQIGDPRLVANGRYTGSDSI